MYAFIRALGMLVGVAVGDIAFQDVMANKLYELALLDAKVATKELVPTLSYLTLCSLTIGPGPFPWAYSYMNQSTSNNIHYRLKRYITVQAPRCS